LQYLRARDWRLHLVCNITTFLLFPTIVFAVRGDPFHPSDASRAGVGVPRPASDAARRFSLPPRKLDTDFVALLQIVSAVQAADPEHKRFDRWALVGLVVMGVMPTTVSSNVTMTGLAGGDVAGTTIEVLLGNTLGTFLSPALLEMFLSGSTWDFGKPVASGGGGIGEVYRQVIEQLGYSCVPAPLACPVACSAGQADPSISPRSVFIPLFVGECIQYVFPKQTKWTLKTFYLAKVGTFCLLLVIWCVPPPSETAIRTAGLTLQAVQVNV